MLSPGKQTDFGLYSITQLLVYKNASFFKIYNYSHKSLVLLRIEKKKPNIFLYTMKNIRTFLSVTKV